MNQSTTDTYSSVDDVIQRLSLSHVDDGQDQDDEDSPEVFPPSHSAPAPPALPSKRPSTSRDDKNRKSSNGESAKSSRKSSESGNILKRILPGSSSSSKGGSQAPNDAAKITREQLAAVTVERLPQHFVLKYLGHRACSALWGIKNTRPAVDELVAELKALPPGQDLPLVDVVVSMAGITASPHRQNTSTRPLADKGLTPLEFVSYAVQDTRYPRVAAFILVREMSSRSRVTECHAYLCDTALAARRVALSVALAFKTYAKKMEGRPHRFQVDLRSPAELKAELSGSGAAGAGVNGAGKGAAAAECEA